MGADPKRARAGGEPGDGCDGEKTTAPVGAPGPARGGSPSTAASDSDEDDGDDPPPPPPPPLPRRAAGDVAGDALPVTSASGDRVYCALAPPLTRGGGTVGDGAATTVASLLASNSRRSGRWAACLLSAPLEELQEEADRVALEAAIAVADVAEAAEARAAAAVTAGAAPPPPAPPAAAPPPVAAAAGGVSAARRAAAGPSALWADRHAPAAYTDLLSDEATNRAVLRWLGGWRETVFGGPGGPGGRAGSAGQAAHHPRLGGGGRPPPPQQRSSAGRPDTRPPQKVLLLTGPPGLGKTTLAHIAAAHCGYRALEVNASDERSAAALAGRVRDAVEMGCVADRGAPCPAGPGDEAAHAPPPPASSTRPRPVCVIVDEVDGAAGGPEGRSAVAALLRIAHATGGSGSKKGGRKGAAPAEEAAGASSSDSDGDGGGSPGAPAKRPAARRKRAAPASAGAGTAKGPPSSSLPRLARPIIAIANDAYAPALRPLRAAALVLTVRAPPPDRLIGRLQAICAAEGVRAERRALARVVAAAGGDARAALHALQLLARKAGPGGAITDAAAASARAGVKDARASAFEVWGALLQARPRGGTGGPAAMRPPPGARGGPGGAHHASDTAAVWDAVADFGDADLIFRGLHEALPIARLAEGRARRLAAAADALSEGDALLGRATRGGGAYSLLRFAPGPALAFRAAVAGPDRPRFIGWPMTASDAARARDANGATLKAWLAGLAPAVRSGVTASTAALDLIPALLTCAARPPIRPLAPHLLTPAERAALSGAVASLAAYGLSYAPRPPGAGGDPPALALEARRAAAAAAAEEHGGWRGGGAVAAADRLYHRPGGGDGGEGGLALAPPIDDLCAWPARAAEAAKARGGAGSSGPTASASAPSQPAGPPQPVRALLAQEVEREHIRRREAAAAAKAAAPGGQGRAQRRPASSTPGPATQQAQARRASLPLTVAERAKEAADALKAAPPKAAARPTHWLDALQARAAGGGAKAAAARAVASAAAAAALDGGLSPGGGPKAPACTRPRASFKFHEGYTNAVRRPVRGRDLL